VKLLILDIDETLIHASEQKLNREPEIRTELYFVYKRPYLETFLSFCRENFQVAVWTTAGAEFAQIVVEELFPKNYPIVFLWSRERCTRAYDPEKMEPYYVKNLAKLKRRGYALENIIMVDDTPQKLEKNYGNLVQIKEWLGSNDDRELLRLMSYLKDLKNVVNVRTIEKRSWHKHYEP